MNDVLINKRESIERCIRQAREYYRRESGVPFSEDFLKQDAIAINIQRACEQAIDLANHLIRTHKLGLPKESRESFIILARFGLIPADLSERLQRMVGFRNILIHQYQVLDLGILVDIVQNRLQDLLDFADRVCTEAGIE
jgi:uncharacterized protein YutE (UPF0331/DUF86 family)